MTEAASSVLAPWANYYVLTGSSAAALTGLMFVVITLVTGEQRSRSTPSGVSTFSTPTVMHFGAALLVAVVLSAPWRQLVHPAAVLVVAGFAGVVYIVRIAFLTRQLTTYKADTEDLIWHTLVPLLAYAAIFAGATLLLFVPVKALFAVAGGAAVLILTGIRNAWDVVTYLAVGGLGTTPPRSGSEALRSNGEVVEALDASASTKPTS